MTPEARAEMLRLAEAMAAKHPAEKAPPLRLVGGARS